MLNAQLRLETFFFILVTDQSNGKEGQFNPAKHILVLQKPERAYFLSYVIQGAATTKQADPNFVVSGCLKQVFPRLGQIQIILLEIYKTNL